MGSNPATPTTRNQLKIHRIKSVLFVLAFFVFMQDDNQHDSFRIAVTGSPVNSCGFMHRFHKSIQEKRSITPLSCALCLFYFHKDAYYQENSLTIKFEKQKTSAICNKTMLHH